MNQMDYFEAGIRVFGLHPINPDATCSCGKPDCNAAGKHPQASNWQHTPEWSEDQLEVMEMTDQFKTGFGVLVKGLLVIDVDARNGGVESFERLCSSLGRDLLGECKFAVATGSGGGSMHLYFKGDPTLALMQHHDLYKGIDFKSSGFVVGAGSMHKSGNAYEVMHGHPDDIGPVPEDLINLLIKQEHHRAEYRGESMDITQADLVDMLAHINPDCDHETWYRCGMALHHATNGTGFELWDTWSKGCMVSYAKSGRSGLENRWHSFGKSTNPVTLGTLIHHAEAGGWVQSVTFNPSVDFEVEDEPEGDGPFSTKGVDLLRPPGFVGDVCRWINDQCLFPREHLSVAAALVAMGNVCGLRYTDDVDGVTANMFALCVAGSGTGKEAVQQAMAEVHRAAGLAPATHGTIKSEQEIMRNLIRHQAALYIIDELGILLAKIANAGNSGASYHEGTMGTLMAAYSKAAKFMLLTGDLKDDVKKTLKNELSTARKIVSENEDQGGHVERRIPQLIRALEQIDNGLERPFLSLIGFTTPVTFDALVTPEQATNGFVGRAILVSDKETNPRAKKDFKPRPMPTAIQMSLMGLYGGGDYDPDNRRVEFYAERVQIRTDKDAKEMLNEVAEWAWSEAEKHKEATGYEAIPRRAREIVSKISLVLAAPSGIRTIEHVRWAFAFVKRDVEEKTRLAFSNEREKSNPKEAIGAKVMNLLGEDHEETHGVLINRCRKWPKREVETVIKDLEKRGLIKLSEYKHPVNGRPISKWSAVNKENA